MEEAKSLPLEKVVNGWQKVRNYPTASLLDEINTTQHLAGDGSLATMLSPYASRADSRQLPLWLASTHTGPLGRTLFTYDILISPSGKRLTASIIYFSKPCPLSH